MACGTRTNKTPSLFGSLIAASAASRNGALLPSPRMSIGDAAPALSGTAIAPVAAPVDSGTISPASLATWSAARTPGPPALLTTARRGPSGLRAFESASAVWNRSSTLFTRSTPTRRRAASSTSSSLTVQVECQAKARAAAPVRPALIMMIGFCKATSRAAERKDRMLTMDSM